MNTDFLAIENWSKESFSFIINKCHTCDLHAAMSVLELFHAMNVGLTIKATLN